ncbi:hypothetical protein LCGC14_1606620 [marine sediment metagenome]|uniref:Uncharacterized protein n=1 Tax=marine sediment metagenome TaxID=412755 RepID=A0A0F9L9K4_9ZZZZ
MIELPEMPILSYRELRDAKFPVTPPFTDDERVATTQRDQTVKDMLRWFLEWGEEACEKHPPYYLKKRGCSECWQELKDKLAEGEG